MKCGSLSIYFICWEIMIISVKFQYTLFIDTIKVAHVNDTIESKEQLDGNNFFFYGSRLTLHINVNSTVYN